MSARRTHRTQGFALISSYLMLAALLLYSNAITVGTLQQQRATDRLAERLQAQNLTNTSLEEFRENLHLFLTSYVYQVWNQGDAVKAMQWLDDLGRGAENPPLPTSDLNADGIVDYQDTMQNGTTGNGAKLRPKLTLPARTKMQFANAWVIPGGVRNSDPNNDPLAPRLVTVEAEAQVGSTVKRVRATYSIALGMSDIFRYAYFVNNYGWFDAQGNGVIGIFGEARANGDFTFTGYLSSIYVDGDIYTANNPELINPVTQQPARGAITGDPTQTSDQHWYWLWTGAYAESYGGNSIRPTLRMTFPGQPPIGGTEKILPSGAGWDSDHPDQKRYEAQPPQPIPYLGDLKIYKTLATQKHSTLTYRDASTGQTKTIDAVYKGPDGVAGTADDTTPLVLINNDPDHPIALNGPVVVPGDVIIRGYVSGQGTIYAGRNMHIIGLVGYTQPPSWPRIERNQVTGRVAQVGYGPYPWNPKANLGTVCNSGAYYAPGANVPSGCM